MLYPARTVDQSKVLENRLFRFWGPPGIYKAMVGWSDLFFLREIDGNIVVYHMGHREILRGMFPFWSILL